MLSHKLAALAVLAVLSVLPLTDSAYPSTAPLVTRCRKQCNMIREKTGKDVSECLDSCAPSQITQVKPWCKSICKLTAKSTTDSDSCQASCDAGSMKAACQSMCGILVPAQLADTDLLQKCRSRCK